MGNVLEELKQQLKEVGVGFPELKKKADYVTDTINRYHAELSSLNGQAEQILKQLGVESSEEAEKKAVELTTSCISEYHEAERIVALFANKLSDIERKKVELDATVTGSK